MLEHRGVDPAPLLTLVVGLSAREIAREFGVSQRTIVRWRNGHSRPYRPLVERICDRFRRHPGELYGAEW